MKHEYMSQAAELALKGKGGTKTNPCVGAVIVKKNKIIAAAFHEKFGKAHAEKQALLYAGRSAKDSDLYVTLEPCSTEGKTPPCTDAIIKAGVKKVYIGTLDPNPINHGKGVQALKDAGIEVEVGVEESLCKELIEDFNKYITTRTPFVTLKIAQSLDGKIAAASGESKWITSEASRIEVQELRGKSDAVLVGIKTALADNPRLTTRFGANNKPPLRVVLDSFARLPLESNLANVKDASTILYFGQNAEASRVCRLKDAGVEAFCMNELDGFLNLYDILEDLARQRGVMNLLVEGGAAVFTSFLEKRLADKIIIYTAPMILGGGFSSVQGFEKLKLKDAPKLNDVKIGNSGGDIRIEGKLPHF
jgi:diaminohydroxyphosphoribosylaminopyrimidine deaminase/5-amino-6-(5-phosphoribosylamino)uracil reductase